MNTSAIIIFVIVYRRKCYVNIPMDASPMVNVTTTQRRRYYANILMNVSAIMNTLTTQLGTSCSFDSLGLARESVVYPGLFAVRGNNAVGVVPFIPQCFIAAFHTEKAQHLRR